MISNNYMYHHKTQANELGLQGNLLESTDYCHKERK